MRFDKAIAKSYQKHAPKALRKKVAKAWTSKEGNTLRKAAIHKANKFAAKHKEKIISTAGEAGGKVGGYFLGPEGEALGQAAAEKYTRKYYEKGQKLGAGQERRIDRRLERGFSNEQSVVPKKVQKAQASYKQPQKKQQGFM